jgi:hypothetical protein
MRTRVLSSVVVLSLALIASDIVAQTQTVGIPRTSVTIAVPPGFRVAREFSGLEDAGGTSILVAEMPPAGYAQLAATFASPKTASNGFAAQGIKITRIEQLEVGGRTIPLAIGDQAQNNKQFRKYITVMGGGDANAVLITFTVPSSSPFGQSDAEAVLRSVRIAPAVTLEQKVKELRFTFEPAAPFRTTEVAGGTALLTSYAGSDPSGKKPMMMISTASTSAAPQDAPQEAERIFRRMGGFAEAEVTERTPVTFAGGPGYFLAGTANGLTMLQFVRVLPNGTYVRLVARGETTAIAEMQPAVTATADSVDVPY